MALCVAIAGLILPLAGCEALVGLLEPTSVTVSLVNTSEYDVEVTLLLSDEQDIPEFMFDELADELEYVVPAGDVITFARSCEDLQAIMIDDADLLVIGGFGPETSTDLLRDGDEFGCGSTIVFTFLHTDNLLDFRVTTQVR
jgi:hypothetical protein